MGVRFKHKGGFKNTERFLDNAKDFNISKLLDRYGQLGVAALASATPDRSGITADSWGYEIHESSRGVRIVWTNDNINQGVKIAILIQYGHATGTGGIVQGRDYINPALAPVFDQLAYEAWLEVTK